MVDKTEGEAEVREAIAEMEASFPPWANASTKSSLIVGRNSHPERGTGCERTRGWQGRVLLQRSALLNPQKASRSRHSILGSGALPREFRDGLLVERRRSRSLGVSIQLLDDEKRDNRAFRDRDPRAVIGFNRAQRREWIHVVLLTEDANLTVDEDASHQLIEGSWYFTGLDDATEEKLSDIVRQAVS